MKRLDGKVCIITGSNSGVGAATAELFAAEGAKVVITARRVDKLEEVANKIKAEGGEVFLFDMGKPVKINDMACDLIKLHGLVPNKDIKIVYTGLRPGEKLYEELLTSEEGTTSTKHKKIFKAKIQPIDENELKNSLQTLQNTRNWLEILKTLKQMIPTYKSKQLEEAK